MALQAGDRAPEFTLPRADSGAVSLSAYRGGWVVLVFLRYLG
jgi:peroxiredoxin